jgi:tetratricopeptide (TPR) repeat protein/ubiquinone/menaquinone biosynthesis C-methylase UbiE
LGKCLYKVSQKISRGENKFNMTTVYKEMWAELTTPHSTEDEHANALKTIPTVQSEPSQSQRNSLLETYQNNRYEDAEKLAISITRQFPKYQLGWKVLGAILQQTDRIPASLVPTQKAVELNVKDAEAHNNLGNTLQALGRLEDAIESYQQSVVLQPNLMGAHTNLMIVYNNFGNELKEQGRLDLAIESYRQALKINPEYPEANYNMGIALSNLVFTEPAPELNDIICKLLDKEKYVRPADISKAACSLLRFDPIIKDVFSKISAGKMSELLQEIIVDLSNVPLLIKMMEVFTLPDLEFENVFKDIRSAILLSISDIKHNPKTIIFQTALSLQCFLNEYLYEQTDVESEALKELENLVEEKLTKGQQPSPVELACLASYKSLHEYSWLNLLSIPVELKTLQRTQVLEPEKEKQLKSTIPILQEIKNNVSCKVQEQYEQNPYPRWVNLQLPIISKPISTITQELNLKIENRGIDEVDTPQILIAGCGTGEHPISTASMFKNCNVLAIDLSLSSVAYAKRKTEELGISNIEYMQADILDLSSLDRKFDIIESGGVLHHMDDPMAGWKVLTDCLNTGGFMRIGLYSELARKGVVQIRDEIEQSDIESSYDAMKSFRNTIVSSEEEHHKLITMSSDFYSMSTLRDLLFHVQEHRFTIPQIEASLTQLGLMFCGFENREAVQKFKLESSTENALYDFEKWNSFEKENPRVFAGMYQFWCQKV